MSEGVLQQRIDDVVEDALHEQRMGEALRQSRQDFEDGRYCSSREDLVDAVRKKRAARAEGWVCRAFRLRPRVGDFAEGGEPNPGKAFAFSQEHVSKM